LPSRPFPFPPSRYTSGHEDEYFGWTDARQVTVRQLAAKFLDRFAEIARLRYGRNWPYAG
jgi:hypothetical protein